MDRFLGQSSEWLRGTGPDADIVISSRVRLARNLEGLPFSHWADATHRVQVMEQVKDMYPSCHSLDAAMWITMGNLDPVDRQFLIERHLMSREHAADPEHKALLVRPDEVVSVMVNEEDHLRIQVMQSGFNLTGAWQLIDELDDEIDQHLRYAYHPTLGFLTACPTNTGTGIRASVMLHLPALALVKQIDKVIHAISKLSLTVRGLYGEGTEASGHYYQISNQVTLGHSETDLIDNIERIIRQVIEHEQHAREMLLERNPEQLEDRVWRAYGILSSARIITSSETIDLLSNLRLGVVQGLLPHIDRYLINELFLLTQPAHLQKVQGRQLEAEERDVVRAELIRQRLEDGHTD